MKLNIVKQKNNTHYYLAQSFRKDGKVKTKNLKKIGTYNDLILICDDPLTYAKEFVEKYNEELKDNKIDFTIKVDLNAKVKDKKPEDEEIKTNVGYFYLQKIYSDLKIKDFFNDCKRLKDYKYNINDIVRYITFDRILDPKSKLKTYKSLSNYHGVPKINLHDIYRTLDELEYNFHEYQSYLFKQSNTIVKRDTSIMYYDCTNYFFEKEIDDEDDYNLANHLGITKGLAKYGISKEHRPNPIVQMGLYVDADGIPVAFNINPGNTNEQTTTIPTQKIIEKNFNINGYIYCADGGLASIEIKKHNSMLGRDFIITQSIKKLSNDIQDEIFSNTGWKTFDGKIVNLDDYTKIITDEDGKYISDLPKIYKEVQADLKYDLGLRLDRKRGKGKDKDYSTIKQRLIITFDKNYQIYQHTVRERQIERAKDYINNYSSKIEGAKNQNDARRFIEGMSVTSNGEVALDKTYYLDEKTILKEQKYDGFYALATSIEEDEMSAEKIIEHNSKRWQVEDCFRTLKTYFSARPIHVSKDTRIIGHFMICYTALLLFRILEKKLKDNNKENHYTTDEIISVLKKMNVVNIEDIYNKAIYYKEPLMDLLKDTFDIDLTYSNYKQNALKKILKKIS